jgi:hypothetical protein
MPEVNKILGVRQIVCLWIFAGLERTHKVITEFLNRNKVKHLIKYGKRQEMRIPWQQTKERA